MHYSYHNAKQQNPLYNLSTNPHENIPVFYGSLLLTTQTRQQSMSSAR